MPGFLAVVNGDVDVFGSILKFVPERILDVYHACKKTREVIAKNRVPLVFNSLSINTHFYFVCNFARKFAMHEDCAVAAMTLVKEKFLALNSRNKILQARVTELRSFRGSDVGEHLRNFNDAQGDLRADCEFIRVWLTENKCQIDGLERNGIPVLVAVLNIAQLHSNSLPLALGYAKILEMCVYSMNANDFLTHHPFVVMEELMDRHMNSLNIVEIYASIIKQKPMEDESHATEIGFRCLCRMQAFLNRDDIADVKIVENIVISIWRLLSCYSALCDQVQRLDLCRTFVSLMRRDKEEKILEWVWTTLLTFFSWRKFQFHTMAVEKRLPGVPSNDALITQIKNGALPDQIVDEEMAMKRLVLGPYFRDLQVLACESLTLYPHNQDIATSCRLLFAGCLK
jgi:hypothetical protein